MSNTLVACLTPPGQGAIATLGIAGPAAWDAIRAVFRPRSAALPKIPRAGQFWLGHCGEPGAADEVVLAVESLEPVTRLAIHSHGGRAVVRLLLDLFATRGLLVCAWDEYMRRTGGNSLRTAAAIALVHATTTRTAAILLDQHNGAFSGAIAAAIAALDADDTATARNLLAEIVRWASLGRRLTTPWRVAVAGAPNVGKSSLVNALAGYQRSVVSPVPGTTRDVVTARIAVDGWPVELADTAGMRHDAASLESQGIERARITAASADLCLWVVDAAEPPIWPESPARNLRVVVNKVDLPAAWDPSQAGDAVRVSAATGQGVPELCAALAQWLVPVVPTPGAAMPFTQRLCDGVVESERFLNSGQRDAAAKLLRSIMDSSGEPAAT